MTQILIIEDDTDIAAIVAKYLNADGFDTQILDDGQGVVEWVREHEPALILLDLMLPNVDGLTILRKLRQFSQVPVIITTARIEEIDRLRGFDLGADDYVCKPYSARELSARVRAMLRRLRPAASNSSALELNSAEMRLCFHGQCIELSALEYRLFELFLRHPGRVYSRDQIIGSIYDDYRALSDRTVDSHIRNLRKKVQPLFNGEAPIQSVYGAGYKYVAPR